MAWASKSSVTAASDKVAGTSITSGGIVTAPGLAIGDVAIVIVAKDNAATANGNTSEITSVVDSDGVNVYQKLREFCNSRGAANGGATISVWYSKLTDALANGATFTANFSDTRTASAISAYGFSIGVGSVVSIAANATDSAVTNGEIASMAISGLTSQEYLFVRASAVEQDTFFATTTGGYINFLGTNTTGGGAASNMAIYGEWDIATGTGSTSNPAPGFSADNASVFLALIEAVPPASTNPGWAGGGWW